MTNQETHFKKENTSTSTADSTLNLRILGYGVETFAGDVDFDAYKYFEENDIDLEEYNSMVEFGDENSLDIPEKYNFASSGLTETDNRWHIHGAYLCEENMIEIINADEEIIWESDCDPDSLIDSGITLISTANYDDIVDQLQSKQAMLIGRLFESGTIFDTSINDIDEFDASNLIIYYFEDESGWIISSIEYKGEVLDNEDSASETSSSEFIWEARQEDNNNDVISEDEDLGTLTTDVQSIEITEPAMLIRISQAYRDDMTPKELYDATRSAWKVNLDRANTIDYAFAVYKGEIKEVYKVAGWHEAGTTFVPSRQDILGSGRFEFVGTVAEDAIRDKYLNKSVKHMFKKGAVIPTMYVNC